MKIQSKWILVCLFLSFALGTIAADLNGIVIRVDDHRVYIDLGENDGVNIGDEFRIISQKNQQEIARLNIKEVFAYAALGDLVEKQPGQEIQLSDPVYRSMEAFFDNTLSENPLQEKRKMKITFSAAAVGLALSALYFDHKADDYYEKYQKASILSDAKNDYKNKTKQYDRLANVALGGSCLCAGLTISLYLWD